MYAPTEVRLLANGNSLRELPYSLRAASCLVNDAPEHTPFEPWRETAIMRHLKSSDAVITSGYEQRVQFHQHCLKRMQVGIPVNRKFIREEKTRLRKLATEVNRYLPADIIASGRICPIALSGYLSASDYKMWPKKLTLSGIAQLCVDTQALLSLNHELAKVLLAYKEVSAGKVITAMKACTDGRHRYWSNHHATITGRDKPVGACFLYLPAKYRESILRPKADMALVQLDYAQQEPLIVAAMAGDRELVQAYEKGDMYELFLTDGNRRDEVKRQVLGYIYGQHQYAESSDIGNLLAHYLAKVNCYLTESTARAFSERKIQCYDWQMAVSHQHKVLSIRNWICQATAGSILRKACLLLDKAKLQVVAALHDAVLLYLPIQNLKNSIQHASSLMQRASALILKDAELRVSVEAVYTGGA